MIVVHHLEKSRSQRVLWLLEELELPYEVRRYARDPVTSLAPPELRAVHPLGKSPVICDGEVVLAESGAIIEYLIERYGAGRLRPEAGSPDWLRYTYWMHYAEGSLMPLLVMSLIFSRIERAPWPVRPIAKGIAAKVRSSYLTPGLRANGEYVEQSLAATGWFAGAAFSAADIQMSFPIEALQARIAGESRPRCAAFLERIHARPAYQRALQTGGPFSLLD